MEHKKERLLEFFAYETIGHVFFNTEALAVFDSYTVKMRFSKLKESDKIQMSEAPDVFKYVKV